MSQNNIGCSIESGFRLPNYCIYQMGGVEELYLIKNSHLYNYQYDSIDRITSVSYSGTAFYLFQLVDQTCNYEEKEIEDNKTGLISWNQDLNIVFHQNKAVLRKQLLQLIRTQDLTGIYKDNNSRFWLLGKENYLKVEAKIQSGQNLLDFNGQKLTLNGIEKYPAYEILSSAITYSNSYINGGRDFAIVNIGIPNPQ